MTDPWIQRFDEKADEDERYDRHLARERMDRAREKAAFDDLEAGCAEVWRPGVTIRALEPSVGPIDTSTWIAPPRPPRVSLRRLLLRIFLIVLALAGSFVLAVAVAVMIFMGVAWVMGAGA